MKIMITSDAWRPQVNGVVRTLEGTARELQAMGHTVDFLTPLEFSTVPCPTYPDIRLSLFPGCKAMQRLSDFDPDALHIATEGPLGLAAATEQFIAHLHPRTQGAKLRAPLANASGA